jgi:hypothetical protein
MRGILLGKAVMCHAELASFEEFKELLEEGGKFAGESAGALPCHMRRLQDVLRAESIRRLE